MDFQIDPAELHQFPDRLFRRELQHPANLRELIEDLDSEQAARLDFERMRLWQREHTFDDWRRFERDLPFLIPYLDQPDEHLLLCLLLEHQSQADRLMPLRMLVNESMFWENEWRQRMRWRDLMWMLISWAIRRRPYDERPRLVQVAMEYQPDPNSQEEVQTMSTTLGQTLEELAEQRGIEQGIEQGELAASRRLLCRLLEKRFGPVTDELRHRIHQVKELHRLEQAIVDCPSLDSLDELEL